MDKVQKYEVKQVIVVRTNYPDGKGGFRKLRTGKIAAQASHAAMSFLAKYLRRYGRIDLASLSEEERYWMTNSFAKVVVGVDTEEELIEIHEKALRNNMTSNLITDAGRTEFDGVPTNTCIAIGPHRVERFEGITSDLRLL